ncbi:GGDEF domain-containing protein [Shewanella sairae]|uniref:diguanylate cyclase n=1 Tax=Shewanella sairae TaxID=190310 RepID=A0ABQ4P7I5_9GAMM|nr:membrane-associated sensor domain-containing protein [Shewanella sairae]MCL1128836.1 membrane-associated sensor domain-containing protein [Shewanella sairae]GIU43426.1 GGDEF domain-containing protein [Shewanella sairae]
MLFCTKEQVLKSHQYQTQLQSESLTIIKRGIVWATYVSSALLLVVMLNIYYFDKAFFDAEHLTIKLVPLALALITGIAVTKVYGVSRIGIAKTYAYLGVLVAAWCYLLVGLEMLSSSAMQGIESLADVLVILFAFALFPNRIAMLLGILPFLVFGSLYHFNQYSATPIYPITKFLCFLGIVLSGQKIISGWFTKAVLRNIEKKKLLAQFKLLALIDGLTSISNRRHFDDVLRQEIKSSERSEQPLSIILVDIDYFKLLNDSLGHQMGDEYLMKVAQVLNSALDRPRDLAARYGGEEFVLVLPDTDATGASHVANKVKWMLEEAGLMHPSSGVSKYVTVSQGIALWQKGMLSANLLERADAMLYQAKFTGRNCYVSES